MTATSSERYGNECFERKTFIGARSTYRMTNRYHLPVVITTIDSFSKEEAREYVERILANLEETEAVYRTYVESDGIDEGESERLLDMLDRIDDEELRAALESIDELSEEDDEQE